MRILLHLSFLGSNYHGFQKQKNALTIQNVLENKLFILHQEKTNIVGCSRTDTGVNAESFYCHFDIKENTINYKRALNSLLPNDIYVIDYQKVSNDFHARFSCLNKIYVYRFQTEYDLFKKDFTYFYCQFLDIQKMEECCTYLKGTHNFYAFTTNDEKESYLRTIFEVYLIREGTEIIFSIKGDGFLRYMVRTLSSALLNVGKGKLSVTEFLTFLDQENKKYKERLPGYALTLKEVNYENISH
ncbi:MAG: tRNA pseudouridine(38-40) synthase TruA [Bacillales bacterium]|jgi:tRNA pseudouridine38-40 synthase|nr:tRNA pseudouridine(38-40) synthase TruA [Bacillales bacterium]